MTDAAEFLASNTTARPPTKRDQYGRYLLVNPDTGKEEPFTRATTIAKTLSDQWNIGKWRERMVALGMSRRPDLIAGAAALDAEKRRELGKIADAAAEAAGSSVSATLGTALHAFTERADRGEPTQAPEEYHRDLGAYVDALQKHEVTILPDMMERILVLPELGVAGTTDRIVQVDGRLLIADLKTGKSLDFGGMDIAIQLALYAHASHWLTDGEEWRPMPAAIDKQEGMVFHLPVGKGRCEIKSVDIEAGWEMVQAAMQVRQWRKRKDLLVPWENGRKVKPEPQTLNSESANSSLVERKGEDEQGWLTNRIKECGKNEVARKALLIGWPEGVPAKPPWTDDQQNAIEGALTNAEAAGRLSFPPERPQEAKEPEPEPEPAPDRKPGPDWTVNEGGTPPSDDQKAAVAKMVESLSETRKDVARQWTLDSRHTHPFSMMSTPRQFAVTKAVIACLDHLVTTDGNTERVRQAIAVVTDTQLPSNWYTGAILGALSAVQASRLQQLAEDFGAGKPSAVTELATTVAGNS